MSDLELYGDFAVAGVGATVSLHAFTGELRARLVESSQTDSRRRTDRRNPSRVATNIMCDLIPKGLRANPSGLRIGQRFSVFDPKLRRYRFVFCNLHVFA